MNGLNAERVDSRQIHVESPEVSSGQACSCRVGYRATYEYGYVQSGIELGGG